MNHKLTAYNSYILRLLNIPLKRKTKYSNELEAIKTIAIEQSYHPGMMDDQQYS